jgi:L-aspartate oxidase
MEKRFDILVIGSGIAGLYYALKIAAKDARLRIAVVTKKHETDTSTNRAQGGIAAVLSGTDSFDTHITDTLRVGCGICHRDVVERVDEAGPTAIEDLAAIGVEFTRRGDSFDLGREGGHSTARVVHASDITGREIERALLAACHAMPDRIFFFPDHIALDLITCTRGGERVCAGAFVFSEEQRQFAAIYAPVTLLATGGLGQVYFHTSNPLIATGDGVAMAHRAGVSVGNLEFVQFHPTTLYAPGRWPFLISEAVRGEGGRLRSVAGKYFMDTAHEMKDLAPRDVVAREIDRELKSSGEEYVLLDVSHLDPNHIMTRFPNIYSECLKYGFDITKRAIPVVPAAHYACGGVVSKLDGTTELRGLFVAGEVAMTGMHGANRLASNSLLEAVVMAQFAAESSYDYYRQADSGEVTAVDLPLHSSLAHAREKVLISHDRRELRRIMSDFVGIVRTNERLGLALEKVHQIRTAVDQYYLSTPATYNVIELRNIATVADLIITCAMRRKESRGLHYMSDFPAAANRFAHDTIITGHFTQEPLQWQQPTT